MEAHAGLTWTCTAMKSICLPLNSNTRQTRNKNVPAPVTPTGAGNMEYLYSEGWVLVSFFTVTGMHALYSHTHHTHRLKLKFEDGVYCTFFLERCKAENSV